MKRRVIITVLVVNLLSFSSLFAEESKKSPYTNSDQTRDLLFESKKYSYLLNFPDSYLGSIGVMAPKSNTAFREKNRALRAGERRVFFSLGRRNPELFSLKTPTESELNQENKKRYFRAAIEITALNLTMWAFNRYVITESWAYISWDSMRNNLKSGFSWDKDTFWTNQLGHPFHGAIHYSIARANNLSYLESTLYSFLASYQWEVFLETRGDLDNPPSKNDLILNTLGAMTAGEILFRTSNLFIDESSVGMERVFRELMAFVVNPGNVFRIVSGDAFKVGHAPEKHDFSLKLPFGAYKTTEGDPTFHIAMNLEYQDCLNTERSSIRPYEWFTFKVKFGFQDYRALDKEILTTGIIAGKKIKNGLAGLFGVFDYLDTQMTKRMSAIGVGPGLITASEFGSQCYFNSSEILYLILGGSSPSIDSSDAHFGTKIDDPYYFGPGMLGRVNFELGKKRLGSIDTGFSQYWIHSIYTNINEYLGILNLNINLDISKKSRISIGYDYYVKRASLQDERFKSAKPIVRALYTFKF